jgi:2-polyprenyl-3-methyl-5-hydroxy-6-metoxy-1,4-benzoquinol methylase
MSSSPTYLDPIVIPLLKGDTVLDVGCGYGRWCHLIRSNFWEAGMEKPPIVDGLDAFEANVEYCQRQNSYRQVWQQVLPTPLSGQWDTILACEMIEHIAQDKVEETVEILEKAARQRIIFSTPNWPAFRGGDETIVGYNDYEAHLSYLSRDFFRKRGYKLIGGGFGNPSNFLSKVIKGLVYPWRSMLESVPRILPVFGNSLIAYKDI